MNKVNCPLCNSLSTRLIETINASEIEYQYMRSFGLNTNLHTENVFYLVCDVCQLGFFYPMATGNEMFYEQFQQFEWYYMNDKPEYALAKEYIPSTGSVLEVGSGKAAFADVVGKYRYVGLEFNDEAIVRARKIGVTLLKESIEQHSANNKQKYKAVVTFQVLEHVANPSSFIRSCVDALQEDGRLILVVPNHDGICGLTQNYILDMPPHHVTHWSGETLTKLAPLFGLELLALEFEPVAEYHRTWARKAVWETKLRQYFGMRPSLLDTSFPARIVSKMAAILAKSIPLSVNKLKGHAVVAAYRRA